MRTQGNEVSLRVNSLIEYCRVKLDLAILSSHTPHYISTPHSSACSTSKLNGMSFLVTSLIKESIWALSWYVREAQSALLQHLCKTFLAHYVHYAQSQQK